MGLPLRMSGAEGIQAEKMQAFAEEIRRRFKLPVHLWDERLTSAQANRLLRETEMSIKRRGAVVDQMAAVLILQMLDGCEGVVVGRWPLVVGRPKLPRISRIFNDQNRSFFSLSIQSAQIRGCVSCERPKANDQGQPSHGCSFI